jgi:hypothetical protein
MRQNKDLETFSDSIGSENALEPGKKYTIAGTALKRLLAAGEGLFHTRLFTAILLPRHSGAPPDDPDEDPRGGQLPATRLCRGKWVRRVVSKKPANPEGGH